MLQSQNLHVCMCVNEYEQLWKTPALALSTIVENRIFKVDLQFLIKINLLFKL